MLCSHKYMTWVSRAVSVCLNWVFFKTLTASHFKYPLLKSQWLLCSNQKGNIKYPPRQKRSFIFEWLFKWIQLKFNELEFVWQTMKHTWNRNISIQVFCLSTQDKSNTTKYLCCDCLLTAGAIRHTAGKKGKKVKHSQAKCQWGSRRKSTEEHSTWPFGNQEQSVNASDYPQPRENIGLTLDGKHSSSKNYQWEQINV